ncbi:CHASE2 domain-containing protein [Cupriavidus necator H16]|uniref:histidine kinase n=1 Tax=Cupriavidus necator (strain ATCC 17699 / DSM 428 / KCTC 22496 / NCIMB 10442 / H16 / Stanier 337) TaxID=381666 RepID=Q0JZ47_CUPNH|nr:CHASE2 domain-containing protein [Cupriavidus necator]QCC04765.1 CHASE2 domain-containing protein [Cupriavidus necator H16]QQB79457.1 CHASE2 domain-containing protein [Cupriavidus necator]WKA43689.1 CHASE2 and HATPase_c domain-containing protein [Cupriavidus necator]CAJ96977.1 signal transduction histidine kinase containing CHASE2 sensor domain [Cupriavidus necator H16]
MVAASGSTDAPGPAPAAPGHAFGQRTLIEWCLLLAAVLALVVLAARQGWAERADLAAYDIAISAQHHPARDDIVIVGIDDASITAIGRWPWRRAVLAQLVERIAAGGPRVIGVDVILSERDTRYPQDDAVLARSLARAGNVVLPVVAESGPAGMLVRYPLAGLGTAVGHINMVVDTDGVARQVYLSEGPHPVAAAGVPHLAAVMAAFGRAAEPPGIARQEPARITEANGWERSGRLRIPYAGPPGTFARVSARDVLDGRANPAIFAGKAVLIGALATGMGDVLPTPVSRDGRGMSGVEILANTVQALTDGDAIVAVPRAWQVGGTLLAVLLAALAALRLPPRGALVATGLLLAALLGGSLLLLALARLWFAPAAAALGCVLFYPLWSWLRQEAALRFLTDELARLEREPGLIAAPHHTGATLDSRMRAVYSMSAQLRGTRRFLSDGLESLPDATAICDLDGGVMLANRRCVALAPAVLDGEPAHAPGAAGPPRAAIRALIEAIFPAPAPALAYWQSLHDRHAGARIAPVPVPDGGIEVAGRGDRRYLLHGAPLHAEAGAVAGLIVSVIDITAIRIAERQREQMLRFLSHDMRSPQASILALIELHERRARRDGAAAGDVATDSGVLARIAAHARRTMTLADDFISVARAESKTLAFMEVELGGLVLDATDQLWALANARDVTLQIDLPDEPAVLQGEPTLLARAIANLVSNAIKFSPQAGTVTVSLTREPGSFVVAVQDHGPGIAEADQARLFEPFARLHEGQQGAPEGTGLGLVLVRAVAERHGGKASVRSAAGAGAEFRIELPVA